MGLAYGSAPFARLGDLWRKCFGFVWASGVPGEHASGGFMRLTFVVVLIVFTLVVPGSQQAQQTQQAQQPEPQQAASPTPVPVTRDAQAVTLLQNSLAAMGGTVPTDSSASGNVTLAQGSLTSTGTVKILTRGTNETSIQFKTDSASWSVIYSNGEANRVDASGAKYLPLEYAASSQCLYFPMPFVAGLLNNPDFSIQYVAQETVGSSTGNHIVVRNTFNSVPANQPLADFTITDIWLDATTSLPLKIGMVRREAGGSSPRMPISFEYSNFQLVSGVNYPFTIQESINGSPWITTTIQSVAFVSGLTDTDFPIAPAPEAN
jgi:hypothetical protein